MKLSSIFAIGLFVLGATARAETKITKSPYHGWPEAYTLSNGKVEAVVVPAIGRVMQFRFAGMEAGPFWENRAMDGKAPDSNSSDWGNFGGDKSWPSQQADWPRLTGRGWPPPAAFDSMPVEAKVEGEILVLVSRVDSHYGIRERRMISLPGNVSQMRIVTEYEKAEGAPVKTGVWIITQLKDPERVFMPIPAKTLFRDGYNKQSDSLPEGIERDGRWISCTRSAKESSKIGTDASALIWADSKFVVLIESPRIPRKEYPDNGSSAEVYTNPDPLKYVELEMLGPLRTLKMGDKLAQTNTYSIFARSALPLAEQVRAVSKSH